MCPRPGPQHSPFYVDPEDLARGPSPLGPLSRAIDEATQVVIRQRARELERRLKLYTRLFPIEHLMLRRWVVNGAEVRTDVVVGEGPRGL